MAAGVIVVALAGAIALAGCSVQQTAAARKAMAAPAARARTAPAARARTAPAARTRTAPAARTRAARAADRVGERVPTLRARGSGAADGVGERVFTFVDHSRLVRIPGQGLQPRKLVTIVRYPLHPAGPVGLIVFGHGFDATPTYYWRLLEAWAQAGYVVAAPVFPRGNQYAPGGPDEFDIVNQPGDMSFVISRLLAASAEHQGPLAGLIDPNKIAVSGQSDGAETALAVAYDSVYRDPRVRAAVILSGDDGLRGTYFPPGSPPLLATLGTADHINPPLYSYAYFAAAQRPKFLLRLIGAGHMTPYTDQEPQLSIVEHVTIGFLKRYLDGQTDGIQAMLLGGDVAGVATLTAYP
jgi:dienelactone hydrolase